MRYKHIIFDIDGTMLDSAYADITALQRVIHELQGKKYEPHELHFALGIPGEITLAQLGIENVVKANRLWNDYMKEAAHTMRIFDGIRELIIELKGKGVQLGIITSKKKMNTTMILHRSDLIHFLTQLLPWKIVLHQNLLPNQC